MATRLVKESTEVTGAIQDVVNMAVDLGVGQWAARLCPECNGGSSKERSLSLNVEQNGIIKYYCHRAACGFSGNAYTSPAAAGLGVKTGSPAQEVDRSLRDPVSPLSDREKAFFLSRYNLPASALENRVYRTESRYALSILRPDGTRRGFITRRPYEGSPAQSRSTDTQPTKTLTYLEASGEPCQSWYGKGGEAVIMVEDPLSAMRITSYWESVEGEGFPVQAVAILGTGVNAEKIREIQQVAKEADVYIALDADATGQAFAMARKWGSAFKRCRVIVLSKDIKDSSDAELAALPI